MDRSQALEARKRLYEDFEVYAPLALKIRTKEGTVAPLVLNKAQRILYEAVKNALNTTGIVRIIVLKGRQQGLSTLISGLIYHAVSQRSARKAKVIAHVSESTTTLFEMAHRYHANCPGLLRPATKYSSKRELSFNELDSSYNVSTAGGEDFARGETLQYVHASEVAFWPATSARKNWNGLEQAVPNTEGTMIFIESTANGVTGVFHDLWKGAVAGENGFTPVFIPWYVQDEYRETVSENFQRTPEEEDLAKKYGLDDEQLMFRRLKVARNGVELFKQEYPFFPDEAFLTTGRPVFNPDVVTKMLQKAKDPIQRLALDVDKWEENPRGDLWVYEKHDKGETYYIGADVAMGVRGRDYSVAQVMDSKKRLVATYRAHVHPDHYATVLHHLGLHYNAAFICPENNGHGILTVTRLIKDLGYPNYFAETIYDQISDKETVRLGFSTTVKTKPLIIDQLRAAIRDGDITINDKTTLRELLTYVVTETGAMEAEPGCFDDCVMALALCNHVNQGSYTPIENRDEWYFTPP